MESPNLCLLNKHVCYPTKQHELFLCLSNHSQCWLLLYPKGQLQYTNWILGVGVGCRSFHTRTWLGSNTCYLSLLLVWECNNFLFLEESFWHSIAAVGRRFASCMQLICLCFRHFRWSLRQKGKRCLLFHLYSLTPVSHNLC